jgi:ComEC/Rec2-related protein
MHRFKQTDLLLTWFCAVLCGLVLARRLPGPPMFLVVLAVILMLAVCRRRDWLSFLAIFVCGLLLGLWRGGLYMKYLQAYQPLMRHQVTLRAKSSLDAVYGDHGQLSFDVAHLQLQKPYRADLVGGVRVQGLGATMIYRGDLVELQGQLTPTKGSNQARMSYAKIHLLRRGNSWLDNLRRRFVAGMASVLPEPSASFGVGLLIGQRSTIPKATNDQLSTTGLTHLVAVSGYNLTIIIMAIRSLLGRGSKFQSTAAAIILIFAFVLVTGLSASIVRAALVSVLSLMAWYYGRAFRPIVLISLAAAVTAWLNPFYLWSDIGWYLSFLAFFGVLLLGPLLTGLFRRPPKLALALLIETTSAQLMTLPIIMYIFGRLSVIGLISNLLVVPLVPLAMLLSLTSGLVGLIWPVLGGWLAWPARILLSYMLEITSILSRLPHAAVQHQLGLVSMLAMYAIILLAMVILWRFGRSRSRPERVTITDTNRSEDSYVRTQQMVNHQAPEGR